MNNTLLKLLQIFENETDNEHALTKKLEHNEIK